MADLEKAAATIRTNLQRQIKKGALSPDAEGEILGRISAEPSLEAASGASLVIEISDDGPGPPASTPPGTGLDTTRRRLQHLYGDAGHLTLDARPPRGAIARLTVPAREAPR